MQLRTALPSALLIGVLLGLAVAGLKQPLVPSVSDLVSPPGLQALALAAPSTSWDIPVTRNESVDRFVRLFGGTQSDRMALYLKRSGRYEGMIRGKLRARGMPEDLLYLSMIESGFNPTARSPAEAVGLWQFVAPTGRRYGLRIDGYVDERRDPERSTDAALRYLADLHGVFGSWYLAAAAYNSGEARVSRVMKEVTGSVKGREEDFWRIRHRLPGETREYVPLIVAAALVGKEPQKYGLGDVERWMPIPSETARVPGGLALGAIARAVGVGEREMRLLNPSLIQGMTPPGAHYRIRIPAGRAELLDAYLEQRREETRALAQQPGTPAARVPNARSARASPSR